jgi:formylglycine-generating enzyme required for sulfatase activity
MTFPSVPLRIRTWALCALLSLAGAILSVSATIGPPVQANRPGSTFRDCQKICPEMVVVPAGSFLMGSQTTDHLQAAEGTEQPQHHVNIGYAFAVSKFEVTRDEYAEFVRETNLRDPDGCHVHEPPNWPEKTGLNWHHTPFPQTGRDPVVCVSWREAQAYTKWLSEKTGHAYRLLSEAEWEYAARAGANTESFWGDRQEDACQYANGVDLTLAERFPKTKWENVAPCHDGYIFTAPVGSFKPNGFGLYDMEGNAFEWVMDCWVKNYDGAPMDGSARIEGDCIRRVNRGGSWTSNPTGLRPAHRGMDLAETTRVVDLGFRVARSL